MLHYHRGKRNCRGLRRFKILQEGFLTCAGIRVFHRTAEGPRALLSPLPSPGLLSIINSFSLSKLTSSLPGLPRSAHPILVPPLPLLPFRPDSYCPSLPPSSFSLSLFLPYFPSPSGPAHLAFCFFPLYAQIRAPAAIAASSLQERLRAGGAAAPAARRRTGRRARGQAGRPRRRALLGLRSGAGARLS